MFYNLGAWSSCSSRVLNIFLLGLVDAFFFSVFLTYRVTGTAYFGLLTCFSSPHGIFRFGLI